MTDPLDLVRRHLADSADVKRRTAEACGPAHVDAGSPGTTWAITKVRTMTPATTITAITDPAPHAIAQVET